MSMGLDPTNPGELLTASSNPRARYTGSTCINELRNLRFEQPGDYSILIEVDDDPILATKPDGELRPEAGVCPLITRIVANGRSF